MRPIQFYVLPNRPSTWSLQQTVANGPRFASAAVWGSQWEQDLLAKVIASRENLQAEGSVGDHARRDFDTAVAGLKLMNERFIKKLLRPYRRQGLDECVLESAADLGLFKAARDYDPKRGTQFNTCLGTYINHEIKKDANNRRLLTQSSKIRDFRRVQAQLEQELGRKPNQEELETAWINHDTKKRIRKALEKKHATVPTPEAIEAELHRNPIWLKNARRGLVLLHHQRNRPIKSLNQVLRNNKGSGETEIVETVAAPCSGADQKADWDGERIKLAIDKALWPRDKAIIKLRAEGHSLNTIGRLYGITRERVRQIVSRAQGKVKRWLKEQNKPRQPIPVKQSHHALPQGVAQKTDLMKRPDVVNPTIRDEAKTNTVKQQRKPRPSDPLYRVPTEIRILLEEDRPMLKQLVNQLTDLQRRFLDLRLGLRDGTEPLHTRLCGVSLKIFGTRLFGLETRTFADLLQKIRQTGVEQNSTAT